MKAKTACQVCHQEFSRDPNVESYGGRLCPSCYQNDLRARGYYEEIFHDEADLVDHAAEFREKEIWAQREYEALKKDGMRGLTNIWLKRIGICKEEK